MTSPDINERSQAKMLWLKTAADQGLVERPMLAPHLEYRALEQEAGEGALLVSESFSTVLWGGLHADIVPLLDGERSRQRIVTDLAGKHSPLVVQTALASLAWKGYVVSSGFAMDRGRAAYWSAMGVSPLAAEERLSAARVSVVGEDGDLASALAASGVPVRAGRPTLEVVVTDDYLDSSHALANRRHLASKVPWMLVKPGGLWPVFGPAFHPGASEGSEPCWACLAHRVAGNREVEGFLRAVQGDASAITPRAQPPSLRQAVLTLAAVEIARLLVLRDAAPLRRQAISFDALSLEMRRHSVLPRLQCAACGDAELHRPDRAPVPITLRSSPKPVRTSGGLRTVAPEETVRRYRHLVDPFCGVVTQLARITDEADSWLHVSWAGSNLALRSRNFRSLRASLRSKSSGKGSNASQAHASALCEAVERYSGVFHGDEIRRRARMADLADGAAIHPNSVQLFSERQYDNAAEINAGSNRFVFVPERFDPEVLMDWTPAWSLTQNRWRYLPTCMLYYAMPLDEGPVRCTPDSNGCAAGNTLEEAILQGFFELVERDAFACWWYNRASRPSVDLDSFADPYLAAASGYYARHHRTIWLLDVTSDLGIPTFVAVSRRTDKEAEDILFAAGSHLDPGIAAYRAVCELNQYLQAVRDVKADGSGYLYDDPESLHWWRHAKLAEHRYLAPSTAERPRRRSDYSVPETTDMREDVEHCRALVERKGLEFIVLDQTRPDVGMPVAKTIVPGLRHFWARFAPGRLYDVPVALGWRESPCEEADLNPIPVFI